MSTRFAGFPPEALTFFRSLARNNRREWFLPRKPLFEEKARQPMGQLVECLNAGMKKFAPAYVTDPAKAIFRLYRDTRFSKDKTPYKDHIAAYFTRRGLCCGGGAGFYFSVSHKGVEVGGGIYMPSPEALLAIRNHIAIHHEDLRKIARARAIKTLFGELHGERLTRPPKGFVKGHPAEDLLRFKQFLVFAELPADLATTPALYTELQKRFQAMTPFIEFLNAPLARPKKDLVI